MNPRVSRSTLLRTWWVLLCLPLLARPGLCRPEYLGPWPLPDQPLVIEAAKLDGDWVMKSPDPTMPVVTVPGEGLPAAPRMLVLPPEGNPFPELRLLDTIGVELGATVPTGGMPVELEPGACRSSDYEVLVAHEVEGVWILEPGSDTAAPGRQTLETERESWRAATKDRGTLLTIWRYMVPRLREKPRLDVYHWQAGGWQRAAAPWEGASPVLLVHGINADYRGMTALAQALSRCDPALAIYAADYGLGCSIDDLGAMLAARVGASLPQGHRLRVVAHSMGGLVTRSAIDCHGLADRVSEVITVATPHLGAPTALLTALHALRVIALDRGLPPEAKELIRGSLLLQSLNVASRTSVTYHCLGGTSADQYCTPGLNRLFEKPNDGIVELSSSLADLGGEGRHDRRADHALAFNHSQLVANCGPLVYAWLKAAP